MAVPHLDTLSEDDRVLLASEYCRALTQLESARYEIVEDYKQWVRNYEGDVKPAESEKPWEGASEAHIPKTSTDIDIAFARLMNAYFGQFPKHILRPLSGKWVDFARETQKLSEYLEDVKIPLYSVFGQAFMTVAKYGTVIIYNPWENRPVKHMELDDNGTFVEADEGGDLYDRPNPRVIHPRDFVIPYNAMDVQSAPWCGYKYKLRHADLRLWKKTGFFREEEAAVLETMFSNTKPDGTPQVTMPTGSVDQQDDFQREREEAAGFRRLDSTDEIEMVHLFARVDIDGDGIEEEVNFHLCPKAMIIPRIAYCHYKHHRRPFIDLHFLRRDGIFFSVGIAEMLEDIQRNIDVTFRQVQDNNTFKNTQTIKAKEGGSIQPDEKWHPARIWFVRQMDELEVFRLGDATFNTSMSDIEILMSSADKRTGLPDSAAGVAEGDRATATATLALLQEASRRIDLVIGGLRERIAEYWMQTLELYAQFKPIMKFPYKEDTMEIEGDQDLSAGHDVPTMMEWHFEGTEAFRDRVMIKPTVSTAALNKAVLRQETEALLERMIAYNRSQIELLNLFLQTMDPTLKSFLAQTMDAEHLVMERIAETFEFAKDSKQFLPKPGKMANDISETLQPGPLQVGAPGAGNGAQPNEGLGTPQGLLPNPGAGVAPGTTPGRPTPDVGIPQSGGAAESQRTN